MSNIIEISEKENRLYFENVYNPVVCGNTNYFVKFYFTNELQHINTKTAVFIVGEKSKQMQFEGDLLRLPLFPNAPYVELLVHAKDGDDCYTTTSIRIRLQATKLGNKFNFD